jgi:hypothetical protein
VIFDRALVGSTSLFGVAKVDAPQRISLAASMMNDRRHLKLILAVFAVAMVISGLFVIVKGLWIGDHAIVVYGLWAILGGIPLGMLVIEGVAAGSNWVLERLGLLRNGG